MKICRFAAIILLLALRAPAVVAQYPPPPRVTHVLRTRDGSTLLGRIVSEDSAQVRFETSGGILTIARDNIAELTPVRPQDLRGGEYWFPDPTRTRLLLAPTGRMLNAGEAYYQNTYLLLQNFYGGINDRVTIGGGFAVIPTLTPDQWGYYAMPKVGIYQSADINVAAGALVFVPGLHAGGGVYSLVYGVGTLGPPNGSITAGAGWGYQGSSWSNDPMLMLGGERRISRRVGLITENYGFWGSGTREECGPGLGGCNTVATKTLETVTSYGLRFIGEKIGVDFAFVNLAGNGYSWIFPGIPYIAFSVRF